MATTDLDYNLDTNGERTVVQRLAQLGPKTIFDVGANEGDWSLMVAAEMPEAQIHAFEIIGETFLTLNQKVAGREKIVANNFGLFEHSGELRMHIFDISNKVASHMPYPHGPGREIICQVRTGDQYMHEKRIEKIDFLKMDVEGAEPNILKGFSAAIEKENIDVIQFEYGRVNIMTHFLLYDFYKFLEENGYIVGKIYPDFVDFRAYDLNDEDFLGPNYLACRRARSDILDLLGGN